MPRSPNLDQTGHRRHRDSRSRSPYREPRERKHHRSHRTRSRSRDNDRHHRHKRQRTRSPPPKPVVLPYKAKQLSKSQFKEYKPLFQSYLDIQKQIDIYDIEEREVKGRWKSFVGKWNRGELARSWYDPSMLKSAQETVQSYRRESPDPKRRASPEYAPQREPEPEPEPGSDDDDFGPAPPTDLAARHSGHGPTIPRLDDLAYRNEIREEDRERERANYVDDIRFARKQDRKAQKERLDELAPRADPGSRERQLEKKRETTNTMRGFRDAKEGGDVEVGEADLMGDEGIEGYKKRKKEQERQKSERELRKEEILRAKAAERDEKLAERRAKEAKTMDFLKSLAKERFG